MILSYFIFLEIAPMVLIIYILQKTSQKKSEDELPSVFNSFVNDEHLSAEAASNIVAKLLTRNSFFGEFNRSKSKTCYFNENIQDEGRSKIKKRNSANI